MTMMTWYTISGKLIKMTQTADVIACLLSFGISELAAEPAIRVHSASACNCIGGILYPFALKYLLLRHIATKINNVAFLLKRVANMRLPLILP